MDWARYPALLALVLLTSLMSASTLSQGSAVAGQQMTAYSYVNQARLVTRAFDDSLRRELKRASRAHGLIAAVGAYRDAAPGIASDQSAISGFEVRRTALKLRNLENAASDWERRFLRKLIAKRKAGAGAQALEQYELVRSRAGEVSFRYMKAIVVRSSCLGCHGNAVSRGVKSQLSHYYHEDKSWGFKAGDVIGGYSLVKLLR